MTAPRDKRLTRKAGKREPEAQTATVTAAEPRWVREPRALVLPLKVGREWEQVRRIAYL